MKQSIYKGVCWKPNQKKWRAEVNNIYCGCADTEREAVILRDKKIIKLGLKNELQIFKKV